MASGQFITLLQATSRSCLVKPSSSRPSFYNPIKNYGQANNGKRGRGIEERAPSTAEEFQRVAEEKKAKEAKKGGAAKTVGTEDATVGTEDATIGDTKVESPKNRCNEEG